MFRLPFRGACAAFAVLSAAALAACGSGSSSTTAAHRDATTSTTTPASSAAASTPSTSTSATTSSGAGTGPTARTASVPAGCRPAHTAVSLGAGAGATGHIGVILLLRNSGSAPCSLTGYPGVALVSAGGHHRQLQVRRTPQGFMGGLSPQARANPVVRLGAGQTASALLEGQDVNGPGGTPCPSYSSLLVTPPNQTVTVRVARSLTLCDPQVHPVVAGTSGRQSS